MEQRTGKIAQYQLLEPLGAGGMGEVFVAFDERLQRRVAIKMLPAKRALDAEARGRMLREARAASALNHPNIVTMHEVGEADGQTFIVMELVEGDTLAQVVSKRGALPPAEALGLVRQAADALGAAHEAGILHRDIKTANLMLDRRGKLKVLDFGLSKRVQGKVTVVPSRRTPVFVPAQSSADLDPNAPTMASGELDPKAPTMPSGDLDPKAPTMAAGGKSSGSPLASGVSEPVTEYGVRMGTPGCSALELMRGEEADRRSDVFSLGVVIYELVTGRRPFAGKTFDEIQTAVAKEIYVAPSEASGGAVDTRFDAALAPALRADREQRYASVQVLVDAVASALAAPPAPPARRTNRIALAIGGSVLAIGAVALIVVELGGHRDPPAPAVMPTAKPLPPPGRTPVHTIAVPAQGGCNDSPSFLDEDHLIFAHSDGSGADLWELATTGGAATPVVTGPLEEWRPAAGGKPGETVFIRTDVAGPSESKDAGIWLRTASGETRRISKIAASSAAASGDYVYYLASLPELRRVKGDHDEVVVPLASHPASQVTVSPDGERFALIANSTTSSTQICFATVGSALDCPIKRKVVPGRPAFSPSGDALYYPSADGIARFDLKTHADELVVPGVIAWGGIAVSPSGNHLAYSECRPHAKVMEVTAGSPAHVLVDDDYARDARVDAAGRVAWVRVSPTGTTLVVRDVDGHVHEVTNESLGRISGPSFSADGKHLAFMVAGASNGVHTVSVVGDAMPVQLTTSEADEKPVFARDGRIVFHRWDDANKSFLYAVGRDGSDPVKLKPVPRQVVSAAPASGEILTMSGDGQYLFRYDPVTGVERELSIEGSGDALTVQLSPNAKWALVQAGAYGQVLSRTPLTRGGKLTPVWDGGKDAVGTAAIRDDGSVVFTPRRSTGELGLVMPNTGTF